MRWVLWLALGIAVGGTVWLVAKPAPPLADPLAREPVEQPPDVPAWMQLKSGTLTIGVRGSDGQLLVGAQVGFETPKGTRLYYLDPQGQRTLTDVPLGEITVVAEAPGYERQRRPTRVEPGVPGELKLVLEPEPKPAPR